MLPIAARALARSASLTTPFVRVAARPAIPVSAFRSFTASSITNKDIIQELYVKELKGYKPPPEVKGAEAGQVKELKLPASPTAPNVKEDLSADLQAYATEEVGEEHDAVEEDILEEEEPEAAH